MFDETTDLGGVTRQIIAEHHGVLYALAHYDGCERCQDEGVDSTCPELAKILEPDDDIWQGVYRHTLIGQRAEVRRTCRRLGREIIRAWRIDKFLTWLVRLLDSVGAKE